MYEGAAYPFYTAARIVHLGSFLEHIESLTSLNIILLGVTKLALCLTAADGGIAALSGKKGRAAPLVLFCGAALAAGLFIFRDAGQSAPLVKAAGLWTPLIFAGLPAVMWIAAEIRAARLRA